MMEARIINLDTVCRTCMTAKKRLSPIFSDDTDYEIHSENLLNITGLKVKLNDGLPQQMCTECTKFINNCMKFRERSKTTERLLLELINQSEASKHIKIEGFAESKIKFDAAKPDDIKNEGIVTKLKYRNKAVNQSNYKMVFDGKNTQFDENIGTTTQSGKSIGTISQSGNIIGTIRLSGNSVDTISQSDESAIIQCDQSIGTTTQSDKSIGIINKSDKSTIIQPDINIDTVTQSGKMVGTITQSDIMIDTVSKSDTVIDKNKAIIDRVTCNLCNTNLLKKSLLKHMTMKHEDTEQKMVQCSFCDQIISKKVMDEHIAAMHSNKTIFKCGYCNAKFGDKEKLLEHQASYCVKKKRRVPSKAARRQVECEQCHKFMRASSLVVHTRATHNGVKPVCEHCGHRAGNKRRLEEHLRAKHGYDKFSCTQCDFTSASTVAMKDHERRHRGEKPFVCELCGALFHAAYLLRQHTYCHRTARPAKCIECPATFKSTNALWSHRARTHKRTQPHPKDQTSSADNGHVT